MAEAPSKSSKRNAKRRAKKKAIEGATVTETISPTVEEDVRVEEEPPVVVPVDPITALKRQLEEAKAVKDHLKAQQLRQQLWVLQDTMATGYAGPGAPELDLSLIEQSPQKPKTSQQPPTVLGTDPTEKKLSRLRKKLEQIESLKKRQADGEKLESNQLTKIKTESDLLDEILILEELLERNQLR